ncbi:hypothetical protein PTKIN_Ptkin19aG0020900 [Pterospermum kingtungense]
MCDGLKDMWNKLSLHDKNHEEDEVVVDDSVDTGGSVLVDRCLIGKLFLRKAYSVEAMRNALIKAWKVSMDLMIHEDFVKVVELEMAQKEVVTMCDNSIGADGLRVATRQSEKWVGSYSSNADVGDSTSLLKKASGTPRRIDSGFEEEVAETQSSLNPSTPPLERVVIPSVDRRTEILEGVANRKESRKLGDAGQLGGTNMEGVTVNGDFET